MTAREMYLRILTEMHWSHSDRSTDSTRLHLQDVLISLRAMAAAETGMSAQEVQDQTEAIASRLVRA